MSDPQTQQPNHGPIVVKSVLAVAGMVAFVFVGLVPMYNLICEWTGIPGRTTEASGVRDYGMVPTGP